MSDPNSDMLQKALAKLSGLFHRKPSSPSATVKFVLNLPPEQSTLFQNRTVCDVTEYRINHPAVGKMASWRGSVETEYFNIVFVKGMLTVSLAERECQVADLDHTFNYAMSEHLKQALDKATGNDAVSALEARYNFEQVQEPKDQEAISFTDVMVALNWRYRPGVKVDYDMLMV